MLNEKRHMVQILSINIISIWLQLKYFHACTFSFITHQNLFGMIFFKTFEFHLLLDIYFSFKSLI